MVKLCIKITGANGYLGNLLSTELTKKGHNVSGIKRELLYGPPEILQNEIRGCDAIINLAGATILKRWTKQYKNRIYDSRISTTKKLVQAINSLDKKDRPKKVLSASAIGLYKTAHLHDETSKNFDEGFIGKVVNDWENELMQLPENIDITIFRIGLVLGREAKIIKTLKLLFKLGLGGKIGNGQQAFPFIHEKDLAKAFVWSVEDFEKTGTFNLVAPEQITNTDFTKALAKKLKRPAFIPVPAFALKIIYGKAASLLLESPKVTPSALLNEEFEFGFPNINSALSEIIT